MHKATYRLETQINTAFRLAPGSRDAHYELGRIHLERGEWHQAAEEGEKAFAAAGIGTTDRQIHFLLTRAYARVGKTVLAARHLALFNASGASLRR
ncbi:MAG: hypothetical protein WKF37_12775 [Bryobacteraceae bacterium]